MIENVNTFGIKINVWVSVVPTSKQPDVIPYNIASCPTRIKESVRPIALKTTTLYKQSPICRESFRAGMRTWKGQNIQKLMHVWKLNKTQVKTGSK